MEDVPRGRAKGGALRGAHTGRPTGTCRSEERACPGRGGGEDGPMVVLDSDRAASETPRGEVSSPGPEDNMTSVSPSAWAPKQVTPPCNLPTILRYCTNVYEVASPKPGSLRQPFHDELRCTADNALQEDLSYLVPPGVKRHVQSLQPCSDAMGGGETSFLSDPLLGQLHFTWIIQCHQAV